MDTILYVMSLLRWSPKSLRDLRRASGGRPTLAGGRLWQATKPICSMYSIFTYDGKSLDILGNDREMSKDLTMI